MEHLRVLDVHERRCCEVPRAARPGLGAPDVGAPVDGALGAGHGEARLRARARRGVAGPHPRTLLGPKVSRRGAFRARVHVRGGGGEPALALLHRQAGLPAAARREDQPVAVARVTRRVRRGGAVGRDQVDRAVGAGWGAGDRVGHAHVAGVGVEAAACAGGSLAGPEKWSSARRQAGANSRPGAAAAAAARGSTSSSSGGSGSSSSSSGGRQWVAHRSQSPPQTCGRCRLRAAPSRPTTSDSAAGSRSMARRAAAEASGSEPHPTQHRSGTGPGGTRR